MGGVGGVQGVRGGWHGKGALEHRTLLTPSPHQGVGNGQRRVRTHWIYGGLIKICAPLWYGSILYTYALALKKLNEKFAQSFNIQPIVMVRLTKTRWEGWKRVIIFSL